MIQLVQEVAELVDRFLKCFVVERPEGLHFPALHCLQAIISRTMTVAKVTRAIIAGTPLMSTHVPHARREPSRIRALGDSGSNIYAYSHWSPRLKGLVMMLELVGRVSRSIPRVKGLGIGLNMLAKALADDREIEATVYGNRLRLNPSIRYHRDLLFVPQYNDRAERRFINRVLRPGDYVIDVGANIGVYALQFARLVSLTGRVTAIEPEPVNFDRLLQNIRLNDLNRVVHPINLGVAAEVSELTLYLDPTNPGGHSLIPSPDASTKQIRCVPLSEVVEARRPRLLKIDIEGWEHPVLERYLADTPDDLRPDFIMLEDWPEQRAGDSVALCLANGYEQIKRQGANVMLRRSEVEGRL